MGETGQVSFSRRQWAERKSAIAVRLANGECGGSYGEAVLILCAAISAMAAEIWPGDRIDRRRFIEFLILFSDGPISLSTVSVPLLLGELRDANMDSEERALRKAFSDYAPSSVVTGIEIDHFEAEIVTVCPTLPLVMLRRVSYANLLYERIRSAFTHQYRPGKMTVPFPMTDNDTVAVSYFNWVHDPNRHIYFHIPWLADLTIRLGERANTRATSFPLSTPATWWIDG